MSGNLSGGLNKVWLLGIGLAIWLCSTGGAQAAADWEWTKGQGWSRGAGTSKDTAAEQYGFAKALEQKGEYSEAARQYFLCITIFPESSQAGFSLQRLAKCLFMMENYYQSFKAIEQVIKSYPNTGRMQDLMGIQYRIGNKLKNGARVSLLEPDPQRAKVASLMAAVDVFSSILSHDPYGPYAPRSLIALGDTYLELEDPGLAREQYERLLKEFSRSEFVNRARLGITRANVMEGKAQTSEVKSIINQMRSQMPEGDMTPEDKENASALEESLNSLEEGEAKKMWVAAAFYQRRGTPESRNAWVFTLQELSRRYPKTSYAVKARETLNAAGATYHEPEEQKKSRFSLPDLSKVNLTPWRGDEDKPAFVTPQRNSDEIKGDIVLVPVPGTDAVPGNSGAAASPAGAGNVLPPPAPRATIPGRPGSGSNSANLPGAVSPNEFGEIGDDNNSANAESSAGLSPIGKGDNGLPPEGEGVDIPGTDPQGFDKAIRAQNRVAGPGNAKSRNGWDFEIEGESSSKVEDEEEAQPQKPDAGIAGGSTALVMPASKKRTSTSNRPAPGMRTAPVNSEEADIVPESPPGRGGVSSQPLQPARVKKKPTNDSGWDLSEDFN